MRIDIQNQLPRLDVEGRPMDCHDGCLRRFEGRYYLYGTRYGDTDGFTPANRLVCYSSEDLTRWRSEGEILARPMDGVCYRPYVVWNPASRRYVLWFNWYPKLWEGQFAVGVSQRPTGPFEIFDADVSVVQPEPGDHNVFVDDDGRAYLIYTSIPGDGSGHHGMSVERLDADFTASSGENGGVFATGVEAPAIFKRDDVYRALFGNTCCFCPEGAGVNVYRARSPLGPWELETQLNEVEGKSSDGSANGKEVRRVAGQQTDVAVIPTLGDVGEGAGPGRGGGVTYLWMADLWGSRPDGIKGHDLQHWEPLEFDASGTPRPLRGVKRFSLELAED